MDKQKKEKSNEIESYFNKVAYTIDEILIKREDKRSNFSFEKEMIAKIKSVRHKDHLRVQLYSSLIQLNLRLVPEMRLTQQEQNLIEDTLFLVAPIHAALGFSLERDKEKIGSALGQLLGSSEHEKYSALEKRFLNLLSARREHVDTHFYSIVSIINSLSPVHNIDWAHVYKDIYYWEYNREIQKTWARDFYRSLNAPTSSEQTTKEI